MCTQEQFVRNFSVMADGEVDFFLGAGASISSGIPTGGDLVWEFKRTIYCNENGVSKEKYKDLVLPSTRALLQEYCERKAGSPSLYASNEYSFYFEQCYSDPLSRKRFIEAIVSGKKPSLGYLCLAETIHRGKVKNVWTTNFDSLAENALNTLYPLDNILVCSAANKDSIRSINPEYPVIGKLHGDYRYDWLKNTEAELQTLEGNLKAYAASQLVGRQLVVVGYSGNDESIMSFIENNINSAGFLNKGLLWALKKGDSANQRVNALIEKMIKAGKPADFVEIDTFESLMVSIYQALSYNNGSIDRTIVQSAEKFPLSFSGNPVDSFIKLNSYLAEGIPPCNVFETDITSWKDLRGIICGTDIIAALFSKHIYSFSSSEKIIKVFAGHMASNISLEEIPERILRKNDSIYLDLLYHLIEHKIVSKGMIPYRKNKYYNPQSMQVRQGYVAYDAIEISLSYIVGNLYLHLLPTVHVLNGDNSPLDDEHYKLQINSMVSQLYNKQYNEKLRYWEKLLITDGRFVFSNDGFQVSFKAPAISCGGQQRNTLWPSLPAYSFPEPIMCFSDTDQDKVAINQLKALCGFGPIDFSYVPESANRSAIKLAVLAPNQGMNRVLAHLNSLNSKMVYAGKDSFIPNYEGFERVFHRPLVVPSVQNSELCKGYDGARMAAQSPQSFLDFIKRGINYYSQHAFEFDVLIIYIPREFSHFRLASSISADFNLHDAIKLYATEHEVKIQIIEDKSINSNDPCKVLWGLSTSLYAKSSGTLWHPQAIEDNTAYIGISYAHSEEKGICIGCSQLFDSSGTGIRMVLRKISNPIYLGKSNPYMRKDDARQMMTELREQYYHSNPVALLNRIVIHKTTPFIQEEIDGIFQAFKGIENIELIQIQEYSPWRAMRFGQQPSQQAESFPVKRGMVIPISQDCFLLWTHGSIIHPELAGRLNYYKGSRGIPAPILIHRYTGKSNGDILAKEILMLTKMNWNSGDCLYKVLPVTLDFAKVFARMSKQNEAIFDKAYDFRFFM